MKDKKALWKLTKVTKPYKGVIDKAASLTTSLIKLYNKIRENNALINLLCVLIIDNNDPSTIIISSVAGWEWIIQ